MSPTQPPHEHDGAVLVLRRLRGVALCERRGERGKPLLHALAQILGRRP